MVFKRRDIFSTIIAALLWLSLREPVPSEPAADAPAQIDGVLEIIELTVYNTHRLSRGNWYVIVGDAGFAEARPVFRTSYGIAFLQVVDLSSAALAAQLGVKHVSEILALSDGNKTVFRGSAEHIRNGGFFRPVCIVDIFDYYFFFLAHGIKQKLYAKNYVDNALHVLIEVITKTLGCFLVI